MANKATREQVLGVVEQFANKQSAIYEVCVRKFDDGQHPNEVLMWLKSELRRTKPKEPK